MSSQQVPQKMKKKKNLKEEDKKKCEEYYEKVKTFLEKNDSAITKKYKNLDYFFEYDKNQNLFISNKYEQSLETYGFYNKENKKMYLSIEEAYYLYQTCIINFKSEFNFNDFNLVNLNLYSYLIRSSKIVLVGKILLLIYEQINKNKEKIEDNNNKVKEEINDIDKYYILFSNSEDYKNHKIESIVYQHDSEDNINYLLFRKIINNSKIIYNIFQKIHQKKEDEFKSSIIMCITQGVSMTFLKINDTIEI